MENGVNLVKKKLAKFSMECRWKSGKQIIRPRQIKKNKKIFKMHFEIKIKKLTLKIFIFYLSTI